MVWELSLKNHTVSGPATLGPNGSTTISVTPNVGWFSLWQSLFRDETSDGTLRVGYGRGGTDAGYPSKTIPIKARLSSLNRAFRDIAGMVIILVILAFGGLLSSYVNVDLVNRYRAISIRNRLGQLSRVIGEIGPQLNSQLRVSLWLERGRITSTLPQRVLFTPETAAVLAQSDKDIDSLKVRVDLAAQISDAIVVQNRLIDSGNVAPSLMDQVSHRLSAAQDLLRKSVLGVEELQKIQSFIGSGINVLGNLERDDDELEKIITARIQQLRPTFTADVLNSAFCQEVRAKAAMILGLIDTPPINLRSQADRDINTRKLAVISDVVIMKAEDDAILALLARQDFDAVALAELALLEKRDAVTLNDLKAEITGNPPGLHITTDRGSVRVNTPILMKLVFNKKRFNQAAARRRLECTWKFDHDNLEEKGWDIYHYFPEPKQYSVTITIKDIDQVPIPTAEPVQLEVTVTPQRSEGYAQWVVELQRWAVGFFVALLGLFAGAKEKILSLDTAGAIFALFLLGFGIDMARNLLSPKQP